MFISNTASTILQQQHPSSNRFDMLDPSDLNNNNTINNNNLNPIIDEDDGEFIHNHQNFINEDYNYNNSSNQYMMNYLMDENSNDLNGNNGGGVSFNNDQNLYHDSNIPDTTYQQQQPSYLNQSVNVNLSNAITINSNNYTNYNTNAGQSYYNNNNSFINYHQPQSYTNQFIPPQPITNSSTSSSLYSYPQQSNIYDYNNTPTQSSFQDPNLYTSNSFNSFFDSTPTSLTFNNDVSPQFSEVPQQQQQQPLHHINSINPQTNQKQQVPTLSTIKNEPTKEQSDENQIKKRYRVVRGVSAGGCSTKPPKESIDSDSIYLPVDLNVLGANVKDICLPKWSNSEKLDRRRIIRIERLQNGSKLFANFSIIGNANENPITLPPPPNVDVIEVSCLECDVRIEEYDSQSSEDEIQQSSSSSSTSKHSSYVKNETDGQYYQYYITSVEVVEIVELLIGTQVKDAAQKRKERGRIRSNLVPFWSKKPISSRMSDTSSNPSSSSTNSSSLLLSSSSSSSTMYTNNSSSSTMPTNHDYKMELAKRIMGYEIRKPRGFDKEVRILRWDKLIPALKRALQSYYTEIPQSDSHLQF